MNRILALPVVTLAAAALAIAGCSSSGSTAQSTSTKTAASSTSAHNAADVAFATDMVPHHTQAVEMADLAATRASNAGVKSLAATIKKDQQPEITEMNAWLKAWGQPMASSSMGGMSSTSGAMGGMSMSGGTGMMSAADMASLGKASGAAFDRMWVTMMITHHQGALSMAKTELMSGSSPAAKALARSIVTSQTAQITQLRALLTKLPAA